MVVPAELGDPKVEERIHHRLRIQEHRKVWRSPDEEAPFAKSAAYKPTVYPVIAATRTRAQIVISIDRAARYALWVDRGEVAQVALVEHALAPGVSVLRGAPLIDRRVSDPQLQLEGEVDARVIGDLWIAQREPELRGNRLLEANAPIRTQAGATIAIALAEIEVRATGVVHGDDSEIEYRDDFVHVTGWTPTKLLSEEIRGFGTGTSGGIGLSDVAHVVVPPNACLFDRITGDVVGVETTEDDRFAYKPPSDSPGWWTVFVYSPWGATKLMAHQQADGSWESCASGR